MVPGVGLIYHLDRALDRLNSQKVKSIRLEHKCSVLSSVQEKILRHRVENVERTTRYRKELRPLEVKEFEIKVHSKTKKYTKFELPQDEYRILRSRVVASKKGCPEHKDIAVTIFESDDLTEGLKDPFWKASFEWELVIGDDAGGFLWAWNDCAFKCERAVIDYIKRPPDIHVPSLTTSGSYRDWNGNVQTKDTGWIWPETAILGCEIAALELTADMGDMADLQLKIQEYMQAENISNL